MYEAHYGLGPHPFSDSPRAETYVALPSHDSALRRLRFGIEHGGGPALLFGTSGIGKTCVAHALAQDLNWPTAHIAFPAMPADELMSFLADELGAPAGKSGIAGAVARVRNQLAQTAKQGMRTLLIVDEAQLIEDPAVFESLRLLSNFATGTLPDLALLIVGGPEVLVRISPSLADRLTARALLTPLTEEETGTYVLGRLAAAGNTTELFDERALRELHRSSDGIPRRLNRLVDLALLISYAEGNDRPDARSVEIATREAAFEPIGV